MSAFKLCSWNVKGLKSLDKSSAFWAFVSKHPEVLFWAIQEHHLDVSGICKAEVSLLVSFLW